MRTITIQDVQKARDILIDYLTQKLQLPCIDLENYYEKQAKDTLLFIALNNITDNDI